MDADLPRFVDPPAIVRKADESLPRFKPMSIADAEAAPTPQAEIVRVMALLPTPKVGFVDFGCGADARWCIYAAERWRCKVTGVEIDPARARAAKERVRMAGLDHLITIVEGDAITTDVQADVGVAYLYSDVLEKMKPRIEKLQAFASYLHQPPGLAVTKNGDSWFYVKPQPIAGAVWGNQVYSRPVCNNPNCGMCNAIRAQLNAAQTTEAPAEGSWQWIRHCNNGRCWYSWEWVPNN